MFYEKDEIEEDLLKCGVCNQIFDQPLILPCGELICLRCFTKIKTSLNLFDQRLHCQFCKHDHNVPATGVFPTDKRIQRLLAKKPVKIYRGAEFERTEALLSELKGAIDKFYEKIAGFKNVVKEYCDELRDEVAKDTSEALREHERHLKFLMNEIDVYENKCFDQMKYDDFNKNVYSDYLSVSCFKINEWLSMLNKANLNKDAVDSIYQDANKLKVSLINEIKVFENVLNGKKLHFYERNTVDTGHLGKLVLEEDMMFIETGDVISVSEYSSVRPYKQSSISVFVKVMLTPFVHFSSFYFNFIFSNIENVFHTNSLLN